MNRKKEVFKHWTNACENPTVSNGLVVSFLFVPNIHRNIKSVYVEGFASRERLYDQRTQSFQLRPIRGTFSLYHAFSYSLDLEGRTYERGLISGYCDSLDVRLFPATFTPRQVLSRTTLGSQRSGKRVNAWFLPVSRCLFATNEAERAIGRKTASPSNRSSRDAFSNLSTPLLSCFTNFQGITFRCRLCTR